jgi:glycine/D-amino acid oxidase-like deaminating enzyme
MQVSEATHCLMLREALDPAEPPQPLTGDRTVEVAIVGGGYLGLWTALALKRQEPQLAIAVLEADLCGGGASGRNSGMALPYWTKIEALEARVGAAEALRLCDASAAALGEIEAFAKEHSLDIEFRRAGWLWGSTAPGQDGRWQGVMAALARQGRAPFQELDRAGVAALLDAPGYRCGAYDPAAATLHPGKLARGLRRVALAQGIAVYERTPMLALERGRPSVIATPGGKVTAERVVLAINAWSLRVPELRPGILVITSDDAITAPVPAFLARQRWTTGPIITNSAVFVSGFRPTRDGRVVGGVTGGKVGFGALVGQRFAGRTPREPDIAAALDETFGAGHGLALATSWRGPIDRTRTGLPLYGRLPGAAELFYGYGFSGNGIVGCRLGGTILAALVLGRQDEWSRCGLVQQPERWMPSEPLRYLGAHLVRWAVRQQDRLDRAGRRQGLVGRRLAALAPGGVVTTRKG